MDSSGKWHLWLWVVSEEEEELRGREKKEVWRESKREKRASAQGLLGKDWDRLSF